MAYLRDPRVSPRNPCEGMRYSFRVILGPKWRLTRELSMMGMGKVWPMNHGYRYGLWVMAVGTRFGWERSRWTSESMWYKGLWPYRAMYYVGFDCRSSVFIQIKILCNIALPFLASPHMNRAKFPVPPLRAETLLTVSDLQQVHAVEPLVWLQP